MQGSKIPKYFQVQETTRSRSKKQESHIAKAIKGKTTINSGATFGQNDVLNDCCEVEAKTTKARSFSLTLRDLQKLRQKCSVSKIPVLVVSFEDDLNKQYAVISLSDFKFLIDEKP